MKPVIQTKISTHDGKINGNCFWAAVSSVTEILLEEFVGYEDRQDWFSLLWEVLIKYGFTYVGTLHTEEKILNYKKGVDGYYVVSGESPRGFVRGHAVVYKDGRLVHDPYLGGNGLMKLKHGYMIERISEREKQ